MPKNTQTQGQPAEQVNGQTPEVVEQGQQLGKKKVSLKLESGKKTSLEAAIDTVRAQYGALFDVWKSLPEKQQQEVLSKSPLLAKLLAGLV